MGGNVVGASVGWLLCATLASCELEEECVFGMNSCNLQFNNWMEEYPITRAMSIGHSKCHA